MFEPTPMFWISCWKIGRLVMAGVLFAALIYYIKPIRFWFERICLGE